MPGMRREESPPSKITGTIYSGPRRNAVCNTDRIFLSLFILPYYYYEKNT